MKITLRRGALGWNGVWTDVTIDVIRRTREAMEPFIVRPVEKHAMYPTPYIPDEHYERFIAVLRLNGIEVELGEGL